MSNERITNPQFTPQITKYADSNRIVMQIPNGGKWVRGWIKRTIGDRKQIQWTGQFWTVTKSNQALMVDALMEKFGTVCVVVESRKSTRKCDTRCTEAQGDECVCSCVGLNHQGTTFDYKQVGETTLVQSGERTFTRRIYTEGDN